MLNRKDDFLSKEVNPIITPTPLHSGQSINNAITDGKLSLLNLLKSKSVLGLSTPNLLKLTAQYDFLLREQIYTSQDLFKKTSPDIEAEDTAEKKTLDKIRLPLFELEKAIFKEIQTGYNKCTKKLKLYSNFQINIVDDLIDFK
ncbi:hypothetical protein [Pectinatus haikarae]|uniref:Uncharacterized protein n=1 Tax=Pectinatus haikarae TaxID=349096 RepID=A0ABT9Y942_9FIRM|nr:hypothetical protein [Pectinatus haikarae]MDQ0204364.1 hypothetical protein [Pectinatus haikarae]